MSVSLYRIETDKYELSSTHHNTYYDRLWMIGQFDQQKYPIIRLLSGSAYGYINYAAIYFNRLNNRVMLAMELGIDRYQDSDIGYYTILFARDCPNDDTAKDIVDVIMEAIRYRNSTIFEIDISNGKEEMSFDLDEDEDCLEKLRAKLLEAFEKCGWE